MSEMTRKPEARRDGSGPDFGVAGVGREQRNESVEAMSYNPNPEQRQNYEDVYSLSTQKTAVKGQLGFLHRLSTGELAAPSTPRRVRLVPEAG